MNFSYKPHEKATSAFMKLSRGDFLLRLTRVRPVVDRRFPLEQLADAFRYEVGAGHFGKIGVEW